MARFRLRSYIAYSLRTRGFARSLAVLLRGAWMYFPRPWRRSEIDRSMGIDTDGLRSLRALSIDSIHEFEGLNYEPCPPEMLRSVLRSLPLDFSNYVFLDLGCGKGRALAIASEFRFARLIGVEFARELYAVAVRNMQKLALGDRCVVRLMDVADYALEDVPTVMFLFNPFRIKVLSGVVEKLERLTRPVVVVLYCVPEHSSVFHGFCPISRDEDANGEIVVYANRLAAEAIQQHH